MSFGDEIRRERELREISLREVAQATKINLRYLEAMERNDFSYLPGGLFNRSFVRAYCQHIGVDPEAMVNAYLLEEQSQSGADAQDGPLLRGSATKGREASGAGQTEVAETGARRRRFRWVLALLAVGLIAAAGYLVFQLVRGADSAATESGQRLTSDSRGVS